MLSIQIHDGGNEAAVREHAGTIRTQLAGGVSATNAQSTARARDEKNVPYLVDDSHGGLSDDLTFRS